MGSLTDEKQVGVAIAAVGRLPHAYLVVAGDGPERAALEAQAAAAAGSRVRFTGALADAGPVYAAADVIVLPSRTEGMPAVLIEAGLRQRAVVASRVGAVPDVVVDGETGVLVGPGDVEALARALDRVLTDVGSMGRAARRHCLAHFEIAVVGRAVGGGDRRAGGTLTSECFRSSECFVQGMPARNTPVRVGGEVGSGSRLGEEVVDQPAGVVPPAEASLGVADSPVNERSAPRDQRLPQRPPAAARPRRVVESSARRNASRLVAASSVHAITRSHAGSPTAEAAEVDDRAQPAIADEQVGRRRRHRAPTLAPSHDVLSAASNTSVLAARRFARRARDRGASLGVVRVEPAAAAEAVRAGRGPPTRRGARAR